MPRHVDGLFMSFRLAATLAEEDLCPLPILRKSASVEVPFVKDTVVCIQYVSLQGKFGELSDKMFETYDSMAEDSFSPTVGALCAAKSVVDEVWYRGRIAEIADEGLTVYYVDYGNTEVLPKENFRELLPELRCHAFARELQLPITSAEDLSETITELTAGTTFDAEFATKDGRWQVDLKHSDGSKLSKTLIDMGKATRREDSLFPEEITAYLAHLESLGEIYVHNAAETTTLENLQAELQTLAETLEDGEQEVGSVCLALYEADSAWYRAEILADGRAQFIDYGNADNVTKVKKLPEEKVQLKRFAIKCCVTAPEGREWEPKEAERALELLADAFTVTILEEGDSKIVDITVAGRDLKTGLIEEATSAVEETAPAVGETIAAVGETIAAVGETAPAVGETTAAVGETIAAVEETAPAVEETAPTVEVAASSDEFTAYLAHLESLGEIYVHNETEFADLENLGGELQTLAETLEDVTPEKGLVCLALYEADSAWYRAEILGDGRARFIDYGNTDVVTQVKRLPEEKQQAKRFAIKCCLSAPEGREWTASDAERALSMLGEAFKVKIIEEGDPKVVDITLGDLDLKKGLIEDVPTDNAGLVA